MSSVQVIIDGSAFPAYELMTVDGHRDYVPTPDTPSSIDLRRWRFSHVDDFGRRVLVAKEVAP